MLTSAPLLASLVLLWFMPESPRWLLKKGKTHEFKKVVQRAAKFNKVFLRSSTQ